MSFPDSSKVNTVHCTVTKTLFCYRKYWTCPQTCIILTWVHKIIPHRNYLFGLALLVNFCRHLATIQCRNRCPTLSNMPCRETAVQKDRMSKVVRIFSLSKDWKSWKIVGTALSAAIYLCRVVTGAWWCPEWVGASGECHGRRGRSTRWQFLLTLIDFDNFVTAKRIQFLLALIDLNTYVTAKRIFYVGRNTQVRCAFGW